MPLVEVTYRPRTSEATLRELASCLPRAVSVAVQCADEPYKPPLEPGDVEIRFRELGPYDTSGMDVVIEVRLKWFADRAEDRQQRCDLLRDLVTERTGIGMLGVCLSLPVSAWAQT
jgi:3-hydroxyacyl-CoA dehydrogenase